MNKIDQDVIRQDINGKKYIYNKGFGYQSIELLKFKFGIYIIKWNKILDE